MNEKNQLSDEAVDRLLRIASEQPPVPADAAARVRAAVHQTWQQDVSRRRFQRRAYTFGSLAAAAAIAVVLFLMPQRATIPAAAVARLERSVGGVHVNGSQIETAEDGRATFVLADGTRFRLDHNSRLTLGDTKMMTLDRGAIYIESAESGLEVHTKLGVARDIGTRFEVRVSDGGESVRVRDGIVDFTHRGKVHRVIAGQALAISTLDVVTLPLTSYDDSWDWTGTIAPPFSIEGRSVSSFASWVSSETGMTVRYASPELQLRAQRTTLHGSIGDLTPSVACREILPTAGLHCTSKRGVITIVGGAR
jgi:ferric-dicitrate binding protein FerR (iron transport regulator)